MKRLSPVGNVSSGTPEVQFALYDYDEPKDFAPSITFASGDCKIIALDGNSRVTGAWANTTNNPVLVDSQAGVYKLDLASQLGVGGGLLRLEDQTTAQVWVPELFVIEKYGSEGSVSVRNFDFGQRYPEVDARELAGNKANADNLANIIQTALFDDVQASPAPTTTTVTANEGLGLADNALVGRTIHFGVYGVAQITAYNGTTELITFTALPAAPPAAAEFVIF